MEERSFIEITKRQHLSSATKDMKLWIAMDAYVLNENGTYCRSRYEHLAIFLRCGIVIIYIVRIDVPIFVTVVMTHSTVDKSAG